MQGYQDTVFLRLDNDCYSHRSHKEIKKSIDFLPKDVFNPPSNRFYSIYVPEEVDSLILQFDVILREAEYFSYLDTSWVKIERDSLRVIEGKEPIIVPIELRLHKYVSKM